MAIINQEALNERANNLEGQGLNGLKLVLVTLHPDTNPTEAHLEVHFHNNNEVANILADPKDPKLIFPISGGHRVTAGPGADQVKVESIAGNPADNFLILTVAPIGDYSTYILNVNYQNMDPILSEIDFKFRPGCFNLCAPDWEPAPKPNEDPAIDYLAKDYDSFRHTMIAAMMERVPGWESTSEADLDQVLLEMFSVAADELSDYQDRVMNEAYLGTALNRVSLARHARLMDYHIHQGNQASTWLALKVADSAEFNLDKGFLVWAGDDIVGSSLVVFMTRQQQHMHHLLNQMGLYTWSDSIPALKAGSITADLKLTEGGKTAADTVCDFIHDGTITHLLIQERLNPATGREAGRDPDKRQLLKLLPGDEGAEVKQDPLTGEWFVRIRWEKKDALKNNYCFTIDCPDGKVEDVSLFHGNLVEVYHGRPKTTVFKEPGTVLANQDEFHYERTQRWGTICRLIEGPLAYKAAPPGGEVPPDSTLEVEVETSGGGRDKWDEVISLIHSDDSDEQGDHFIVETDEIGKSLIRFGNGINGKELPEGAVVHCTYQIGKGLDGNIGADKLINFDKTVFSEIEECWNPFDVTNGRAPEPVEEIIRRVPEAYRFRQLRAVTLKDYVDRAEELDEVSRASARYMWTGSWRTVQIAIDPVGTTELKDEVRKKIARHLDAVRLIGEDMEIRPPRFVPLKINVSLCIHPDYWPEDIKYVLEQEFSDGFTPDGRMGFFHPDLWTFGQELRTSQIIGRVQAVKGVDHVISVAMKRWGEVTSGEEGIIKVRPNEIIQVKNDRDHMEKGFIFFDDIKGGRQ
ncbi:MAG: baseplate J/gp47 family protein [Nitrospirota bacterium]